MTTKIKVRTYRFKLPADYTGSVVSDFQHELYLSYARGMYGHLLPDSFFKLFKNRNGDVAAGLDMFEMYDMWIVCRDRIKELINDRKAAAL